jgi:hypothetical protein
LTDTQSINEQSPPDVVVVGDDEVAEVAGRGHATAGLRGTATAGDGGTATSGDYGRSTTGDYGESRSGAVGCSFAGDHGTAISGERGVSMAGVGGRASSGAGGFLAIHIVGADGQHRLVEKSIDTDDADVLHCVDNRSPEPVLVPCEEMAG